MTHEPEKSATDDPALEESTGAGDDEMTSEATPVPRHQETTEDLDTRVREFLATAPPDLTEWAKATAAGLDTSTPVEPVERRPRRRVPTALVVLLLVPVVIWGVYKLGAPPPSDQAAPAAGASSMPSMPPGHGTPELDTEAVADLEAQVEADPTDIAAMSELGKLHLMAGDSEAAGQWQQRILADHPDDIDARLALGVALFNQDEVVKAQEQWERAAELDPAKAEPHYNLGFLYLSEDPPDMEKVSQHWDKVLELEPASSMAETINAHMGGLEGLEPPSQDDP